MSVNDIVAAKAKRWLVLERSGEMTTAQQQELARWRQHDPAHEQEYQRLLTLWQELDLIAGDFLDEAMPATPASEHTHTREPQRRNVGHWQQWSGWAIAACLLVVVGLLAWPTDSPVNTSVPQIYSSARAEVRQIPLADGSLLELGPDSSVQLAFSEQRRRIRLLDGEAFFQVAKDPQRPFVVETQQGDAIAVGTAFNVRLARQQVEVTVHEGVVDVTPRISDTPTAAVTRLQVGEQAVIRAQKVISTQRVALDSSAAWRQGRLVFENQPLVEVIDALNRYSQVDIVIADERLLDIAINGVFQSQNIQSVLLAIESTLPVTLTQEPQRITLHYREGEG